MRREVSLLAWFTLEESNVAKRGVPFFMSFLKERKVINVLKACLWAHVGEQC